MNTLQPVGIQYIKSRILKVAQTAPIKPLQGRGYSRNECTLERVFSKLELLAANHCVKVSQREAINSYGKLGYPKHNFISPELTSVMLANYSDFQKLEESLKLVSEFNL